MSCYELAGSTTHLPRFLLPPLPPRYRCEVYGEPASSTT